ncbi:MAG: GNAT family N-acetyltransferase [Bacteroidales bacterium]
MVKKSVIQDIKALWKVSFGDDDDFIDRFVEYTFKNSFIYYAEQDGKVVSFLNLIPVSYFEKENQHKGLYLYGVATDPQYQGMGLSSDLLRNTLAKMEYDFVVTLPAEASLFPFYQKQGFTIPLYKTTQTVSLEAGVSSTEVFEPLYPEDEARLFAELASVAENNIFIWSFPHYLYLYSEYEREDCGILFFQDADENKKYVVLKQESETISILASNMSIEQVLACIKVSDLSTQISAVKFLSAVSVTFESGQLHGLILPASDTFPAQADQLLLRLGLE